MPGIACLAQICTHAVDLGYKAGNADGQAETCTHAATLRHAESKTEKLSQSSKQDRQAVSNLKARQTSCLALSMAQLNIHPLWDLQHC